MRQQNDRGVGGSGFAVERVDPVDGRSQMVDGGGGCELHTLVNCRCGSALNGHYLGARYPTGPAARHTDSAEVLALARIESPAPDNRT